MSIPQARGSNFGTQLVFTQIVLHGRAYYDSYVSRFALRVRGRSANTAPNSEVHPNVAPAADRMLAEALQMAEDGDTNVLKIYKRGGHRSNTHKVPPAQAP